MRDPVGPPTWLLYLVALGWMFTLGLWVERHRFGGTADLRDDVARLRAERDRIRAELDQRRHSAMPTLRLVHGMRIDMNGAEIDEASARAVDRGLTRLHRNRGNVAR